ncbi:MAG: response regulator transcription factor [Saprospiraceae bacterium]|nr:response regulator transcription factor [Saprospiraceae bacterium]
MQLISVALADTYFLIRHGLKSLLSKHQHFQLVAEVSNETQLLSLLKSSTIDLLIIDYFQLPHFTPNTIEKVNQSSPHTKLLIISSDEDKQSIYNIIQTGIDIFLTKKCNEKEVSDALQAAITGDKFFCKTILNFIVEKSFGKEEKHSNTPLTEREMEIVYLISKGFISKEIATKLNITLHTVYTHRKNILKKLNLHSTPDLVRYALQQKIS